VLTLLNDQWLKAAPAPAKREVGQRVNEVKKIVEEQIDAALTRVSSAVSASRLQQERVDITLPGNRRKLGIEHPLIRTMNEIVEVFKRMGYSVAEGPEVETDYYNFESLNFPPNHPARDTQDTLVIKGQQGKPLRERLLLRTHTSPVQIRAMEKQPPPLRIVVPGKVHRADTADATHSPIFHQVEGLAVDTNITFCDLKGTLDQAAKAMFGSSVKTRFYPSFFPFTEPSDLLLQVRRQRTSERRTLWYVQVHRLDRDSRFGNGGSECVWFRRLRSKEIQRICVWHGSGANRDFEVWSRRHSAVLSGRCQVFKAVWVKTVF